MKRYRGFLKRIIFRTIGTTDIVRRIEWQIIFSWLNFKGTEKVLDIACGTGQLSVKIAQNGCDVHGIDISDESLDNAKCLAEKEKVNCVFTVGNAEELPYPDEEFDTLVCNCSLEHFVNDLQALKEMNRVLKPGGEVMLTVDSLSYPGIKQADRDWHRETFKVVNYYTLDKLSSRLNESGFTVSCSKYYLTSYISHLFFNASITSRWRGIWGLLLSLIGYPLCRISDGMSRTDRYGYGLAVKARKPASDL